MAMASPLLLCSSAAPMANKTLMMDNSCQSFTLSSQTLRFSPPLSSRNVLAMASYNVTLRMLHGEERSFMAPDDDYILVTAEDLDPPLELPSSCRSGACSACCAKLLSGEVDQSDGSFLSEDQIRAGFVLTCVAYPLSDVVLQTHADSELK